MCQLKLTEISRPRHRVAKPKDSLMDFLYGRGTAESFKELRQPEFTRRELEAGKK
jgi:hypothetical protein